MKSLIGKTNHTSYESRHIYIGRHRDRFATFLRDHSSDCVTLGAAQSVDSLVCRCVKGTWGGDAQLKKQTALLMTELRGSSLSSAPYLRMHLRRRLLIPAILIRWRQKALRRPSSCNCIIRIDRFQIELDTFEIEQRSGQSDSKKNWRLPFCLSVLLWEITMWLTLLLMLGCR